MEERDEGKCAKPESGPAERNRFLRSKRQLLGPGVSLEENEG